MPPKPYTPRPGDPVELALALAHEVGNLLAAARLSAYLLAREAEPGLARSSAEDVEAVATQAGAMLAHLRLLLAPDAGPRLHVDPAELVEAVARSAAQHTPRSPRVEVEVAADLPDVRVDSDALHHLLVTLVLAAWDAAPRERRVRLVARRASRGGDVVFAVEDTGAPLLAQKADSRVGPRGRSLALAVAATLAERWGGRIRVVPDAGGTRVEVQLPAADSGSGSRPGGARRRGGA